MKFNSFLGNKDHGGELVNPAIGAVSTLMSIIEGYSGMFNLTIQFNL